MKKLFDAAVHKKFKGLENKSLKNWGNNYIAE